MKKKVIIFILSGLLFFSCKEGKNNSIDVSGIKADFEIKRLDQDLFRYTAGNENEHFKTLRSDYGSFFNLYNYKILDIGSSLDTIYPTIIEDFKKYCEQENVIKSVDSAYSDLTTVKNQLAEMFKHYKYYFPDKYIPTVYTYISGFNISVVTADSIIGISLDKYLGVDFPAYSKLGIDNYRKERMHKDMIKVDVTRALMSAEFPFDAMSDDILENMIYDGKIQYAMECLIPETADSLKWGCSSQKFAWLKKNEGNIWNYIIEQKLLFSTSKSDITTFMGDGPFTTPFSKISAPRAGAYVGFRIIEEYMKNSKDISLEDLLKEKDSRKILTKAKYNPKK